jgi:chlorobactene glucosyltransferase
MDEYFTHQLILHLVIFQTVILVIILSNLRVTHRARRYTALIDYPMVSILVPARNEERNIAGCITSLLAQEYPSFEVLVLDDQSSDGTRSILEAIAKSQPELKVLEGKPPPENLVGKNWACSQLAQHARGELLFFTDADTFHDPHTLTAIVTALVGEHADLLTGFPRQEMQSLGEWLLVPFFSWASLCFIPLTLAYRLRIPALSSAIGQLMLFRHEAYLAIGGHQNDQVSSSIVDDLMLARQIVAAGLRWRVAHVSDLTSCRMYCDSAEAVHGFIKNLFAAFNYRLLPYLGVFLWLAVMFWVPLVVFTLKLFGQAPQADIFDLGICIGLSLALWGIPSADLRIPIGLTFLYPFTILAIIAVALQSVQRSLFGSLTWKGRAINRPQWKWF